MSKLDQLRVLREQRYEQASKPVLSPNKPVTNVTNSVTNNKDVDRVRRWRAKNSDQYKEYQREYMKRYRASKKYLQAETQ